MGRVPKEGGLERSVADHLNPNGVESGMTRGDLAPFLSFNRDSKGVSLRGKG